MSDENGVESKPKFGHLKRLHPTRRTAWCELPEVSPGCAVEGVYAGRGSKDPRVLRAALKEPIVDNPRTPEEVETQRLRFADYLAENVLCGWRNVVDVQDQPVTFTRKDAAEFLRALPADIVSRIANHFLRRQNFLEDGEQDPAEANKALAGN